MFYEEVHAANLPRRNSDGSHSDSVGESQYGNGPSDNLTEFSRISPREAVALQELKRMLVDSNKANVKIQEGRTGLTGLELTVVLGALAVFASIYTYVVLEAIASKPVIIG